MSDKIQSQHLERKAILYVRQSSAYQVLHNQESRKLQYAMRQRLADLGWKEIDVIDEDLGQSAAGTVTRSVNTEPGSNSCTDDSGSFVQVRPSPASGSQVRPATTNPSASCAANFLEAPISLRRTCTLLCLSQMELEWES